MSNPNGVTVPIGGILLIVLVLIIYASGYWKHSFPFSTFVQEKTVECTHMYKVVDEVSIFGCVTGISGTDVIFTPCAGPPQTISPLKLERTNNTCNDGI